jgi:U3 small nucleolar RNA-associated protein 13
VSSLHFFETLLATNGSDAGNSARNERKRNQYKSGDAGKGSTMDVTYDGDSPNQSTGSSFRLASGGEDGMVRIWDLHKHKVIATLDSHVSVVRGLDFSVQENAIVSGSRDKTIILWDAHTWKVRKVIPVLEGVEATGFIHSGAGRQVFFQSLQQV